MAVDGCLVDGTLACGRGDYPYRCVIRGDTEPDCGRIYTIPAQGMPDDFRRMIMARQGVVHRYAPAIYIEDRMARAVLGDLVDHYGVRTVSVQSREFWSLIERFRAHFTGVVTYPPSTAAQNLAFTLAGQLDALPIPGHLSRQAANRGLPILDDTSGRSDHAALAEYEDNLSHRFIIDSPSDEEPAQHLLDFAVRHRALVMDGRGDPEWRTEVVETLGPRPLVFGWGEDENEWISSISVGGGAGVPADYADNLSLLSHFQPEGGLHQPDRGNPVLPPGHNHYVAFVISDGDNVQWVTGEFISNRKWWSSPRRSHLSLT